MNPAELFHHETDTVQLAPGEFLYRKGDKADKMYVLLQGKIDIRVGDYVKTERKGAIIGEASLIEGRPRAANAVAKSACRLAQIDRKRFDFLVREHPHFAIHVMKSLVGHLRYVIFSKPGSGAGSVTKSLSGSRSGTKSASKQGGRGGSKYPSKAHTKKANRPNRKQL
jgi:CRP-like cAMP-binding protein